MAGERYRLVSDFPEQGMGSELMVFDPKEDKVHVLNSTASFVWSCLKEGLDSEAIRLRFGERFGPATPEELGGMVQAALGQMLQKGLIKPLD